MLITLKDDFELSKFPDWRFSVLSSFNKKLNFFFRRIPKHNSQESANGSYLKRFIGQLEGLEYKLNYKLPADFQIIVNKLNYKQTEIFYKYLNKYFKERKIPRISFLNPDKISRGAQDIRVKELDNITDRTTVRLMQHAAGVIYDKDIADAITLKTSDHLKEIFNTIGLILYIGRKPDEVGGKWKIRPRCIHYLNSLFFDFSRMPRDRIANYAYLKQFCSRSDQEPEMFHFYKLINDLGETGLTAITNFASLTHDEKRQIEGYLGMSLMENTLKLKFSIKTREDAMQYGRIVNDLATTAIKHEEVQMLKAKARNLDAQTKRISLSVDKEIGEDAMDTSIIDLNEMLRELSKQQKEQPVLRDLEEIKLR